MPQANQRVSEYVLDERIGSSSYDELWRAHHHIWAEQTVVVKIPTDPAYISNLQRDGVHLHRLAHPNIARPLGFDPKAETPYLISEYTASRSLRKVLETEKLSIPLATAILRQLLVALQFGHEHNIIHGDIRPENILLVNAPGAATFTEAGTIKVIDFGVGVAATATLTTQTSRTASSTIALSYIAPEQREGAPPDAKSDIYSVGVVFFEMLTGERPSGAELPSELNPQVPSAMDDIFRRSYARRDRRYENAKAFLDALNAALGASTTPPAAKPAAPRPPATVAAVPPLTAPVRTVAPKAEFGDDIEISFREDDAPAKPKAAAPPPPPVTPPAPKPGASSLRSAAAAPITIGGEELSLRDDPPVSQEPEPESGAETATPAPAKTKGGTTSFAALTPSSAPRDPPVPQVPKSPSRAEASAIFDEIGKRQLRTPDDIKATLKVYSEVRELDAGEQANLLIRLVKWAGTMAGGESDFSDQLTLIAAASRPLFMFKLLVRTNRGDEPVKTVFIDHPLARQASGVLTSEDYRVGAHLSAVFFNRKLLEAAPGAPLRGALLQAADDAQRKFAGAFHREDLVLYRVNIIGVDYRFDDKNYSAFLVGNSLRVVPVEEEPFSKIRQDPTKHAAAMLEGDRIKQGIKEVRRGIQSPQWEPKSTAIISALRGKLAAAYMAMADREFSSFGWLESLESSAKAGQLVQNNERALRHAARVRSRVRKLQTFPGLMVAILFIGLSALYSGDAKPADWKAFVLGMITSTLFAAGWAALIATYWAAKKLSTRLARTDVAFYHAALFPLMVALIVGFAPERFMHLTGDIICVVLLAIVIVADVMLFKKFRKHLVRLSAFSTLGGDSLTILSRIEMLVDRDWEELKPYYTAMGPLYKYTTVQTRELVSPPEDSGKEAESD